MPPTIWIDVEDLFVHAARHARVSGIERVAFELCKALREGEAAERVRFLRQHPAHGTFHEVPWAQVLALAGAPGEQASAPAAIVSAAAAPAQGALAGRRTLRRRVAMALPPAVREPLAGAVRAQLAAPRGFAAAGRALFRAARADAPTMPGLPAQPFDAQARPDDTLLVLSAGWQFPGHAERIGALLRRHGMKLGICIYDIIPLLRPEWCGRGMAEDFGRWFTAITPLCSLVMSCSQATLDDMAPLLPAAGVRTARIALGSLFTMPPAPERPFAHLPAPGSYVLFVSTLDVRKNHILLFRLWRRLLAERPRAEVPRLVFAGRIGWAVADLIQQLDNANWLDGHIVLVKSPSDAELAALYRGCRFTIYPSLYEGWGLPVVESLDFGKPVLASNATSLPEAGGTLARYFDPDNLNDALAALCAVLDDPAGLAAWEARVRAEFRPTPWSQTAAELLALVDAG